MVKLELVDSSDEQSWDELVARFGGGSIFHTLAWMRVIEGLRGAEILPFGIFDGADLVGVFPFLRLRRGPLVLLASPLGGVGYGGPLVDKSYHPAVFEQLDRISKRFGADYIEFRSLEPLPSALLADRHYTLQHSQTYVLALNRDVQELWANLKSECRTAIRKAQKSEVEIIEATDKSFVDIYFEMVKDTFRKSNRPPPFSSQDYSLVWDMLKPYERIKVLLARHEGQVLAGAIFLRFCDRIYYWDGVAFQAHYALRPNNLLHWTLIEWGASHGLTHYDMLGADIPRIASFKKSFGGELRSYMYPYKDVTWQAHLGRRLYLWLAPQLQQLRFKFQPTN